VKKNPNEKIKKNLLTSPLGPPLHKVEEREQGMRSQRCQFKLNLQPSFFTKNSFNYKWRRPGFLCLDKLLVYIPLSSRKAIPIELFNKI